jgi:hypothetical protein
VAARASSIWSPPLSSEPLAQGKEGGRPRVRLKVCSDPNRYPHRVLGPRISHARSVGPERRDAPSRDARCPRGPQRVGEMVSPGR